jgi:hypothetical protein
MSLTKRIDFKYFNVTTNCYIENPFAEGRPRPHCRLSFRGLACVIRCRVRSYGLRTKLKEPQCENALRFFFRHSVLCCCELFLSKAVSKNETS